MSHSDRSAHHASKPAPEPFDVIPMPPTKPATAVHHALASVKPPAPMHAALPHSPGAAHPTHPPHSTHAAHPRGQFHPLPVVGHAEAFYLKHIEQAEAAGDQHARGAHKVGQHVSSALDPNLSWEQKLKRFMHCLRHYCVVPPDADVGVQTFYQKLGELVRRHAGQEALHLARAKHGDYHRRLHAGEARVTIEDDAEKFFPSLMGHGGQPEWCSNEAWSQLAGLRDHWV